MTATLQPHQQRVLTEKMDLDMNVSRLDTFTRGSLFDGLPLPERDRLTRQLMHMRDYSAVLGERITAFNQPSGD